MADEEKSTSPKMYRITNVVWRKNSRLRRYAAPSRNRFKQFVCGRRLLRKQSVLISEKEMRDNEEAIYEKVREGAITVTTPDGSVISSDANGNLISKKGMELTPVTASKQLEVPSPVKEKTPVVEEKAPVKEPELTPETTTKSDDLTSLNGVGPGRAKKLAAAGITTFKKLAEMTPSNLVKLLGTPMTEDQATSICDEASEREEG